MKTDLTDRIWKECTKLCWKWILRFCLKDIKDVMNVRNPLKYHINKANTGSMVYHTLHKKTAAFKDLQTFKSYFKVRYSTIRRKINAKDIQSSHKEISLEPWLFCKSWRYKSMETYFQLWLFWSQYLTLQLGKWRLAGSRKPNQASEPLAVVDS